MRGRSRSTLIWLALLAALLAPAMAAPLAAAAGPSLRAAVFSTGVQRHQAGAELKQTLGLNRVPVPSVQAAQTPQAGAAYAAGEVLVLLRAGASLSSKKALAGSLGSVRFRDLGARAILPQGERILLITSTVLTGPALVASALQDADVIAASLNYRRYADGVIPNDPDFAELWGLYNSGQTGGTAGADISAPDAWSTTTGSAGVVVADIDSGVAYDHPDLAANMWRNPGEIPANRIDDDHNGYVDDVYGIDPANKDTDPYDDDGHGTHTAGTAAAVGNNGIGVTGVAWHARIMALKYMDSEGSGYDSDAIKCIDYVVAEKLHHGVDVVAINASWGGAGSNSLLRSAINAAGAAGIVFCTSAGNGGADEIGDDNDATLHFPSSYSCANIIAVAAVDDNDVLADSSNYGAKSVDLAAPGVNILSTVPGDGYESWSGTSMATPYVTGAVALCAARFPSETMGQRVERIIGQVDPLPSLRGKMTTGGRLDLAAAVNGAAPPPTPGDTVGPVCAAKNATVKRGGTCKIYFKVYDALSTQVTTDVAVTTNSGVVKKSWSWGYGESYDGWWSTKYTCRLPKGAYRIIVTGEDLAGNSASVVGRATLTVK
ncbi:MAG: S8 family peptidase [Actinobacteria bacterium]|nr:S8 family peptidase [Actinomycetota bacterium]